MLSIQGFSMLRMPFWKISCASVSPIWRKSVEGGDPAREDLLERRVVVRNDAEFAAGRHLLPLGLL